MPQSFVFQRRVEFCETDAAGIVHFSNFLRYMEQAEHAFLRHLGTSVVQDIGDGWHLSWPRVHVDCDYSGSARFEDELAVEVTVVKIGTKSVTYQFEFMVKSNVIARGTTVAVCCRVKSGEALQPVLIPSSLAGKLADYCQPQNRT